MNGELVLQQSVLEDLNHHCQREVGKEEVCLFRVIHHMMLSGTKVKS